MLMELLRKDLRICRLPIISGITCLLGAFLLSALITSSDVTPLWKGDAANWAWALKTGCSYAAILCQSTVAMIGGTIIATERADRSAEFLAYLPPTRWQMLRSKMFVLLGAFAVIWGICLGGDLLAHRLDSESEMIDSINMLPLKAIAPFGVLTAGVGWWASARFSSTGPAVGLAFASPFVVAALLQGVVRIFDWPHVSDFSNVFGIVCTCVGLAAFTLGSLYYLRRVEP